MNKDAKEELVSFLRAYWWPLFTLGLLTIQASVFVTIKSDTSLHSYSTYIHVGYCAVLVIATSLAVLNAFRNNHSIRLFWSFVALGCGVWAINVGSWIYYVSITGKAHPDLLVSAVPLYLHIIFLIAAVVARPHLAIRRIEPYRITLNVLLLVFFWLCAYTIVLFPISYKQYDTAHLVRAEVLYFAQNLLLLVLLSAAVMGSCSEWKKLYWNLLGASSVYAIGSLGANVVVAHGRPTAGWYTFAYTGSAYWFVWCAFVGRKHGGELARTEQLDRMNPAYSSSLAMFAVLAVPIVGIWELFRTDQQSSERVIPLLVAFVAVLFLAVIVFVREYVRQRELFSEIEIAHEQLQLALNTSHSVVWERDYSTGLTSWFGDLQTVLGIAPNSGGVGDFDRYIHPEDREGVLKAIEMAKTCHKPYKSDLRVLRKDGTIGWVLSTGQFHYGRHGTAERLLGMTVDITEHKMAEEALRKSEKMFSKAFHQSPVALALTKVKDHRYLDVNETFEELTGWCREEVIGRTPFDLNVWINAADRLNLADRVLAEHVIRNIEVRYRRKDGTERVGLGFAEVIDIDGEPCILSQVADITDRKHAEEALSNMGRRLIEAHEEERTRIARELHDDINQRLALLAVELEQWSQRTSRSRDDSRSLVQKARARLFEISKDIQALSHRLHSSKLEYLGLVAAANSFCQELSEQNRVEVNFQHFDIPRSLPTEISLVFFRVLQEALHNAVKHSKSRHFRVELRAEANQVHLCVSDSGVGFDVRDATRGHGLGLISMRERLQLVSGALTIESKPGFGTTIRARVPFKAEMSNLRAAG